MTAINQNIKTEENYLRHTRTKKKSEKNRVRIMYTYRTSKPFSLNYFCLFLDFIAKKNNNSTTKLEIIFCLLKENGFRLDHFICPVSFYVIIIGIQLTGSVNQVSIEFKILILRSRRSQ